MAKSFNISIICPDQVGLVSAITGKLFELGANLGDTSFASLGASSEFSSICEVPDNVDQSQIEEQLNSLGALKGGNIRVEAIASEPARQRKADTLYRIVLRGKDNPGLVAKSSQVFAKYQANIVQLNTETTKKGDDKQYVVTLTVSIPADYEDECKAAIEETANAIDMECNISLA